MNAKRGIPFFSLSLAVAGGPCLDDVDFGFVHDFGSGEEWVGERGGGRAAGREAAREAGAKGPDRDPVVRGDDDGVHRRAGAGAWSAARGVSG